MRKRLDRLFWPLFGFLLYAGGLFFVFGINRAIAQPLRGFFLVLVLIVLSGLLAASLAYGLAVIQSRWPRFDLSPNKSLLACCVVLTFFSYFLHLFPQTTDLVISEEELKLTGDEGRDKKTPSEEDAESRDRKSRLTDESIMMVPKRTPSVSIREDWISESPLFPPWKIARSWKQHEVRNRYLDRSIQVVTVSWIGLLMLTFAAPATRARPGARTVALHPIVLVGLGAVFLASVFQAIN